MLPGERDSQLTEWTWRFFCWLIPYPILATYRGHAGGLASTIYRWSPVAGTSEAHALGGESPLQFLRAACPSFLRAAGWPVGRRELWRSVIGDRKIPSPFPMDFGRKRLAHFVCVLAHLPDQPILNRSPRIICDTRNHCLHFFHPNDLGEYMRGRGHGHGHG